MHDADLVYSIFLIFTGAALFATAALYARQAMLVAYIVLGAVTGPSALGLVSDPELIENISEVGIIFLLFLLGLNLYPQKLLQLFRETTLVTLASSVLFCALGYGIARAFGVGSVDALLVGVATMFSSTIVSLKLLPTTVLHHRHTGEVIVSVLLLQDLIAILAMLFLQAGAQGEVPWSSTALTVLALPLLVALAFVGERYLLLKLFVRFDRIQEYVFLLAVGWCLGIAQAGNAMGLSYEIGAFIAGIAVATSPIARHIADTLKPLRDFFLVMFFFALGAGFDFGAAHDMLVPAMVLAAAVIFGKPAVYRVLFVAQAESAALAWETGVRLGHLSEFSLLLVFVAVEVGTMGGKAASMVQLATIMTFVASSYLVVLRYPTPIALSDRLRRD
ncbi:MAG: cation:proton antiporter [Proteobacteria bacterium]|nr:MAG: cation:proton antiporter [Pseudomonadota bacterium]